MCIHMNIHRRYGAHMDIHMESSTEQLSCKGWGLGIEPEMRNI